jgi:flavin reductase (DIM6/NTAB) family NADH-FMN oxidoreductase RutF
MHQPRAHGGPRSTRLTSKRITKPRYASQGLDQGGARSRRSRHRGDVRQGHAVQGATRRRPHRSPANTPLHESGRDCIRAPTEWVREIIESRIGADVTLPGRAKLVVVDPVPTAEGRRMTEAHDVVSQQDFKNAFSSHPAGVAVVTCTVAGEHFGFTATSLASVSAAPPLFSFSLSTESRSSAAFVRATTVAVSLLAAGQSETAQRFASKVGVRFRRDGWQTLPTGEPVIDGATRWIRGRIEHRLAVGGSHLFVVLVDGIWRVSQDPPLVYWGRSFGEVRAWASARAPTVLESVGPPSSHAVGCARTGGCSCTTAGP